MAGASRTRRRTDASGLRKVYQMPGKSAHFAPQTSIRQSLRSATTRDLQPQPGGGEIRAAVWHVEHADASADDLKPIALDDPHDLREEVALQVFVWIDCHVLNIA